MYDKLNTASQITSFTFQLLPDSQAYQGPLMHASPTWNRHINEYPTPPQLPPADTFTYFLIRSAVRALRRRNESLLPSLPPSVSPFSQEVRAVVRLQAEEDWGERSRASLARSAPLRERFAKKQAVPQRLHVQRARHIPTMWVRDEEFICSFCFFHHTLQLQRRVGTSQWEREISRCCDCDNSLYLARSSAFSLFGLKKKQTNRQTNKNITWQVLNIQYSPDLKTKAGQ